MVVGGEKNRSVGPDVADGHRLDIRDDLGSRRIRRQRQRLLGRKFEGFVAEAVSDHLVDPLGVPAIGREQVHDQQMDSGLEKPDCLSREGPYGMAAILVAR